MIAFQESYVHIVMDQNTVHTYNQSRLSDSGIKAMNDMDLAIDGSLTGGSWFAVICH